MSLKHLNILLADDDTDDCFFFKEALRDTVIPTSLITVNDGEELMHFLTNEKNKLPDILFLDLNMPRKNGFECLSEIKQSNKLNDLPVIIFSTSFEQEVVNLLYKNGAQYFIRKPSVFLQFKEIILYALLLLVDESISGSTKEDFVLTVKDNLIV
jgi:CheY-like chemotaxis protein